MENKDGDKGKWCIPKAVQAVVVKDEAVTCDNPSLRLAKFVRVGGDGGNKQKELRAVCKCQETNGAAPQLDLPARTECVWGELRSRLAVNLAGGILENANICLHPHFGYPYLPGSAVKGLARHAAWCEWNKLKGEAKQAIARRIATVFGYPTGDDDDDGLDAALKAEGEKDHAGCVAFLGAFPEDKANIEVDVLTCHHAKYYSGSKPQATDDESPNVQAFPVVASGTTFCFPLVPLRDCGEAEMQAAKTWLLEAIEVNGAGAKTAAGYGWFRDLTQERAAQKQKEQQDKRNQATLAEIEDYQASWANRDPSQEELQNVLKQDNRYRELCKESFVPGRVRQKMEELYNRHKKLDKPKAVSQVEPYRRRWKQGKDEGAIIRDVSRFTREKDPAKRLAMITVLADRQGAWQVYCKIRNGSIPSKKLPDEERKAIVEEVEKFLKGGQA